MIDAISAARLCKALVVVVDGLATVIRGEFVYSPHKLVVDYNFTIIVLFTILTTVLC